MTENTFFKVLFDFCWEAEDRIRANMKKIRIKTLNDIEAIKTRSQNQLKFQRKTRVLLILPP